MGKLQTTKTTEQRSEDQAQQKSQVVFPKRELKAGYASLSIEAKLAAAMMMYLVVDGIGNTPDRGKTGSAILNALDKDIQKAEDLPDQLSKFREVYQVVKKGS